MVLGAIVPVVDLVWGSSNIWLPRRIPRGQICCDIEIVFIATCPFLTCPDMGELCRPHYLPLRPRDSQPVPLFPHRAHAKSALKPRRAHLWPSWAAAPSCAFPRQ